MTVGDWIDSCAVFRIRRIHAGVIPVVGIVVVLCGMPSESAARSHLGAWRGSAPRAKSKPVPAVAPPASVATVLVRTQQARYVTLTEAGQSGTFRYEIDNRRGRAETWTGDKVSLIQVGRKVYAPKGGSSCYLSAVRSSALLPNVAGTLLPSGVAGLRYKTKGRTIQWSIKSSSEYQPHGTVRVNAAGRIVSATVYSGPGVPLTAVVSYPAKAPTIAAPAKLCGK